MKWFTLVLLVALASPAARAQSCGGYQDVCFPYPCAFCNRYVLNGAYVPAHHLGTWICASADPNETETVDCTWCDAPVTECVTLDNPWATTAGVPNVCQICHDGHNVGTAIACQSFYCGSPDQTHCNTVDCFSAPCR